MWTFANVATPFTAATLVVPRSRSPRRGFVFRSARVTFPVNAVATFPLASSAVICGGGVIVAPAAVLLGWSEKLRWVGGPGGPTMANGTLIAWVKPAEDAVRV
jgi:hypothetical protein